MAYPVKYIHESMRGAPVLSGQPGTLIALLDAFLLTGFGVTTAVSVSVSGGVATATLNAGQSFEPYCVVLVEGATPAALNGEARVLTASSTSITWATTAPDGAASGTITIRVAPVGGWEKVYAASNKAVYRSTDPAGSRFYYRIDDTNPTYARVRGFETMSAVDTGTGPFPTDAQISGGGYWGKSYSSGSTPVPYDLAGDPRKVLVALASAVPGYGAAYASTPARGFGDLLPLSPSGDAYVAAVSVADSDSQANSSDAGGFVGSTQSSVSGIYVSRALSGLGGAQKAQLRPLVGASETTSGGDPTLGIFPSAVDGQLKYSRYFVRASADNSGAPRAWVPGVLHIPQSGVLSGGVGKRSKLAGSGELSGRTLVAIPSGNLSSMPAGVYLLDITGPWR